MLDKLQAIVKKAGPYLSSLVGDEKKSKVDEIDPIKDKGAFYDTSFLYHYLPYETYDPETDLFINKKSIGFMLEITNLMGSSEEIETILSSMLSDILPVGVDIQWLLWASPKIGPVMDAFEAARSKNDLFKWLAKKRTDYLKQGAYESLSDTGVLLLRDFRVFMVVSSAKSFQSYAGELMGFREDIESSLHSINIASTRHSAKAFLTFFNALFFPDKNLYPEMRRWDKKNSLSEQCMSGEWKIQIHASHLDFLSDTTHINATCFTVKEFPEKPTQWKMAENLGQMFNETLQIPCPFVISLSLRKMPQEKIAAQTQAKCINRESTAKSPLAKFNPRAGKEYEDVRFLQKRLKENDCVVKTFYQVMLFSTPEKAKLCERRLRDLYSANGWLLRKELYVQFQNWLALLPMKMSEGLFEDLKFAGRLKTMTGFNAINIAPLQGEWKGTQSASLILPGRRGQLALWNPFDNEGNFNMTIMASPGKGKSALTNEYIVSLLGAGGRVWVIDAGRSYEKTCKVLEGQFIEFSENTTICLNPFTNTLDINESMMLLKPLLASMARPISGASEEELAYLEQAIKQAWERKGKSATITTVAECLKEQSHKVSKNLAHLLLSYTKEGIYARFFEGDCTVDFHNPFIVMELQELNAKKDLQRIVLQVLIYLISQTMYLGDRYQMKSCIIDESWDLFESDNIATAKFIEAGFRKARKYRGNFVSIAHSVSDFQKNAMARAAFDCADFKIILGQTEEAINKLKHEKIMEIDAYTERLLKSLRITRKYSECVIKGPDGLSLHRIIFDPYSRILYSTKGEEIEAVNRYREKGLSLMEAIEQVAREFHHV